MQNSILSNKKGVTNQSWNSSYGLDSKGDTTEMEIFWNRR